MSCFESKTGRSLQLLDEDRVVVGAAVGAEDDVVFALFELGADLAAIDADLLAVHEGAQFAPAVAEDEAAVLEVDFAVAAGELVGGVVLDGVFVA